MKNTLISLILITSTIDFLPALSFYKKQKTLIHHEIFFLKAAKENDLMGVRQPIIQKKINIDAQDKQGNSALHLTSSPEIVFELIISGADPNLMNKEKLTPFCKALLHGNLDKAKVLVLSGANPNIMYKKKTSLMLAIEQGNYELVKEIIKAGAKISSANIAYAKKHNQKIASFLEQYHTLKKFKKCFSNINSS